MMAQQINALELLKILQRVPCIAASTIAGNAVGSIPSARPVEPSGINNDRSTSSGSAPRGSHGVSQQKVTE